MCDTVGLTVEIQKNIIRITDLCGDLNALFRV